jgi:transposase InsO family protein
MKVYVVGFPMERLEIDIAGPLTKTNKGHEYNLVISDYFTKSTQAFAIKDQEATTIASILVNEIVSLFGVPKMLHSDKGSNFESKVFREMCKILQIDKTRTTTRRPQSDGMVERNIKTIKAMLIAFVNKSQRNWDRYLSLLMMAYRSSVHEST